MKNKLMDSPYVILAILITVVVVILTVLYVDERIPGLNQSPDIRPGVRDTLHVLSFPEYFPEAVLKDFEDQYNINVQVTPFLSPFQLMEMIESGDRYDIAVVNDYLVKPLAEQGLLKPILHNQLLNLRYMDTRFRAIPYDYGNQYSIPFIWGTVGLTYNSQYVVGLPLSWEKLFDPDHIEYLSGRIAILDDYRVSLGLLLLANGFDPNTRDEDELAVAVDMLMQLVPHLVSDEILEDLEAVEEQLITEEIYMGMMWSGSATMLSNMNHNLRYTLPAEGTIFWVDNLAFTSYSTKHDLAYKFTDYLLAPRTMARLSNTHYHANPVTYSRRYINRRVLNGPAYMNPYLSGEITMISYIGEYDQIYQKYWNVFLDSLRSLHSHSQLDTTPAQNVIPEIGQVP